MKNKETKIEKKDLETLGLIIFTAEKFKNSYFWNSANSAKQRRKMEADNSYAEIEWVEGGNTYTAKYTVKVSCRNVYARGCYTKNGNGTTLTAIRNSYNRIVNK